MATRKREFFNRFKEVDYGTLCVIARDPDTDPEIIELMVEGGDSMVNAVLSHNPVLTEDQVIRLAQNEDCDLWRNLAKHPNCPTYYAAFLMSKYNALKTSEDQ